MEKLTNELIDYRKKFEHELLDDILSYWMKYGVEEKGKGFYGAVDLNGTPAPEAKKSCVLNARILWTFSAAAVMYQNSSYGQIADKAFRVLQENFSDAVHGGYFMELNSDNTVASDIKHTYAQAFVIYALDKYYELSESDKVLNIIKSFYAIPFEYFKLIFNCTGF